MNSKDKTIEKIKNQEQHNQRELNNYGKVSIFSQKELHYYKEVLKDLERLETIEESLDRIAEKLNLENKDINELTYIILNDLIELDSLREESIARNQLDASKYCLDNFATEFTRLTFENRKLNKVINIFKSVINREDAIITCPCIKDGRLKTNIIITLDTINDKDILCNETIKEVLFKNEL